LEGLRKSTENFIPVSRASDHVQTAGLLYRNEDLWKNKEGSIYCPQLRADLPIFSEEII
jgi:hypothetical protein